MKELHMLTFALVVVGALNWGLVGLLDFNLVSVLFGGIPTLERLVYILVGVSAVAEITMHTGGCKWCSTAPGKSKKSKK